MQNSLKHSEQPMSPEERQKWIDRGWEIYRHHIALKTAREIVARMNSKKASPEAKKVIEVTIGASGVPHDYKEPSTDMKVSIRDCDDVTCSTCGQNLTEAGLCGCGVRT